MSGLLKEFLRLAQRHPALHGHARRIFFGAQIKILPRVAGDEHEVGITRRSGLVNDDSRRRAFRRRDLVFVSPATVISHRVALEHRAVELRRIGGIWNRRIVDEHYDRLAAHIDVLVVVPAVLGRDDAVADEHDVGVRHLHFRLKAQRCGDEIAGHGELQFLRARRDGDGRFGRHTVQRDVLDEGAVGIPGLKPDALELIDEITNGELLAARAGTTTFKLVGGQPLDVREKLVSLDALAGGSERTSRRVAGGPLRQGKCERHRPTERGNR